MTPGHRCPGSTAQGPGVAGPSGAELATGGRPIAATTAAERARWTSAAAARAAPNAAEGSGRSEVPAEVWIMTPGERGARSATQGSGVAGPRGAGPGTGCGARPEAAFAETTVAATGGPGGAGS